MAGTGIRELEALSAASTRPAAQPIFIVGCEGSGTTLLRMMLSAHSRIAIAPESNFVPDAYQRFSATRLLTAAETAAVFEFVRGFPGYQEFRLDDARIVEELDQLDRPSLAHVLETIYTAYARLHGKARWGDKTPGYVEQLPKLDALFPDCQVIHIIRDGRDSALSMVTRKIGSPSLYQAAKRWRGRVARGRRDGARLGASRYLEIRYEDLVTDPQRVLGQVCRFLGEAPEEQMLEFYKIAPRLVQRQDFYRHIATFRPINSGHKGRWRSELNGWRLFMVESIQRPMLQWHNYPVSGGFAARLGSLVWGARRLLDLWAVHIAHWPRSLRKCLRRLGER